MAYYLTSEEIRNMKKNAMIVSAFSGRLNTHYDKNYVDIVSDCAQELVSSIKKLEVDYIKQWKKLKKYEHGRTANK